MRVWLLLLLASVAEAGTPCFDFDQRVVKPLGEVARKDGADAVEKGTRTDKMDWASLRGDVKQPIARVLALLLDHNTTRDPSIDDLQIETIESPLYLARHRARLLVKPFLFIKVRWTEDWAYALAAGTPEAPEEVVISYQKIEGTSHMEHFCGSIVLRRRGNDVTDVSQYEESRIDHHSAQDSLDGLWLVLKRLRAK